MRNWRLLFITVVGAGFLLIFLRAAKPFAEPPTKLALEHLVAERNPSGRIGELTIVGSGFDDQTRFVLTPDFGNRRAVKSFPTWGNLQNVTVAGKYLYLANNYRGMQVVDFSAPERPRQIGTLQLPGTNWNIAVGRNFVLAACGEKGLHVIDVEDPRYPRLIASAELGGSVLDVASAGNLAYVANSKKGLQVVDLSDPAKPALLATLAVPGRPYALEVEGGVVFLTAAGGGLTTVDVRDPRHPRIIGGLKTVGPAFGFALRNGIAYVAIGRSGLLVIDVRTPQAPKRIATVDTPGTTHGIALAGNFALLADSSEGIQVADIADPYHPRLIGTYDIPGTSLAVTVTGEHALVAAGRKGLQIIDLQQQAIPLNVFRVGIPPAPGAGGLREYMVNSKDVLSIDISDPLAPACVSHIKIEGEARDLQVAGNFLYVRSLHEAHDRDVSLLQIEIIDISDLNQPRLVNRLEDIPEANDLLVIGKNLWTTGKDGICRLELSTPAAPRLTGCFPLPGVGMALAQKDDLLLAGDTKGNLYTVDIENPETPRLLGSAEMPWHLQAFAASARIVVDGSLALVAAGRNGVIAYSLEDPQRPQLIGGLQLPNGNYASGIAIKGKIAYVSDIRSGLHMIDFSDPRQLFLLATVGSQGKFRPIVIAGNRIFVASLEDFSAFPLPVELAVIAVEDSRLRAEIPLPIPAGSYTLWAANRHGRVELPGALVIGTSSP